MFRTRLIEPRDARSNEEILNPGDWAVFGLPVIFIAAMTLYCTRLEINCFAAAGTAVIIDHWSPCRRPLNVSFWPVQRIFQYFNGLTLASGYGKKNFLWAKSSCFWGICKKRSHSVSCSERKKELRRRRHRRKKLALFARKLETATVSERGVIAEKIRSLTPGCDVIIKRWELEKR
jgi:hypothetical protein